MGAAKRREVGAVESARESRRWGEDRAMRRRRSLARSATVSVTAQKAGGDCVQPMGRASGKATKGASPGRDGMVTASFGISSIRSQTR